MNEKIYKSLLLLALAVIVALALLPRCASDLPKQTVVIKRGIPHIEHHYHIDTFIKDTTIYKRATAKIVYVHDTVDNTYLADDTIKLGGLTMAIKDTFKNGVSDRAYNLIDRDSTFFITKRDTVKISETDTVTITKLVPNPKAYWRGLKHGALIGGAVVEGLHLVAPK